MYPAAGRFISQKDLIYIIGPHYGDLVSQWHRLCPILAYIFMYCGFSICVSVGGLRLGWSNVLGYGSWARVSKLLKVYWGYCMGHSLLWVRGRVECIY